MLKVAMLALGAGLFEFSNRQIHFIQSGECRSESPLQQQSPLDCPFTELVQRISRSPKWRWRRKQRIENFIKDQLVRRLVYSNIENVQGIWTARQLEMSDLRRGSRTRLTLDKLQYNEPMKEEDFTLQAIRRQ